MVDSGWTRLSALTILGYIRAAAGDADIKFLVLTEHHSDHIFGAKIFKEQGAKIIAHAKTKEFLEGEGKDYVKFMIERQNRPWADIRDPGYDIGANLFSGVEIVLPDVTIDE